MASFSLAAMVHRARPGMRRKVIVLREIAAPAVMATDLFRGSYLPIVETLSAAVPRILATYERTLAELTTDSPADVQADLDGLDAELRRLILTLTPRLRDWAWRLERYVRGKWRGAVLSASGVELGTLIGPETARQTLEAAIEWNVALVKDVGEQARRRIASSVFTGLNQRRAAREVAAEIRDAVAMSRRRSIGIASDQLSKLSAALAAERRRDAGLSVFKWRHSGKKHPRPHHKSRDGMLFSENPGEVGKMVEGQRVNAPPPADDRASVPPWCGCREQGCLVFAFD